MKKLMFLFVFLAMLVSVSAVPETNVYYFYSITCSHCVNVADSGILENASGWENVSVEKIEVSINQISRDKFMNYTNKFGIKNAGIPFLVIEQEGKLSYLAGDTPIINGLYDAVYDFEAMEFTSKKKVDLTLWAVVVAALIDSINPCAFGVLLFLMAVLLSMGSSRRAFRAGMLYSFVIFLVYLGAGFGIMRLFNSIDVLNEVKFFVGILVFVGGLIELKDFFWEGKGFSLKIPTGAKPWLEKYGRKGTVWSLIVLGVLVALVELPCTGGIYLAILSMISESGAVGTFYLILYNVIFVLPLVFITYFISKGANVDSVNAWVQKNKKWMRLGAGLVMIGLALYLIGVI